MDCLKFFQSISGQRFYGSHQLILSIDDTLALHMQEGRTKIRVKDEEVSFKLFLTLLHFPALVSTLIIHYHNIIIHVGILIHVPPSDIFPPYRKGFPYPEFCKCFDLDKLLKVLVVLDPLVQFSEIRLLSIK